MSVKSHMSGNSSTPGQSPDESGLWPRDMRGSVASLQYLIDSICANFTVDSMYDLVKVRLSQGPFTMGEIAREIRCKDRTLDFSSSKMLAGVALEALEQRGDITIEGDCIYPAA